MNRSYLHALFLILLSNLFLNAQTFTTEVGESLDDENKPRYINFIDADSTGIYFHKQAETTDGLRSYIDKYDVKTLKLKYRCILPAILGNENRKAGMFNYDFIVRNGGVYVFVYTTNDRDLFINNYFINSEGQANEPKQIEEIKGIGLKDPHFFWRLDVSFTSNKNFMRVSTPGDVRHATHYNVFNIIYNKDGIGLIKTSSYVAHLKDEINGYFSHIYNDGYLERIFNVKKNTTGISNFSTSHKLTRTIIQEAIKNDSIEVYHTFFDKHNKNVKDDNERFVFGYNRKRKDYCLVSFRYNSRKEIYENFTMRYIDDNLNKRLVAKENIQISYRESFDADSCTFKVIDWQTQYLYEKTSLDVQKSLILNITNKNSGTSQLSLVPILLGGVDFLHHSNDMFSRNGNKNYSSYSNNNYLYIFTNEHPDNSMIDPNTFQHSELERCSYIKKSDYVCYKVNHYGQLMKYTIRQPEEGHIFTIPNNFAQTGNYVYVYVLIDGKRSLGKIVVND